MDTDHTAPAKLPPAEAGIGQDYWRVGALSYLERNGLWFRYAATKRWSVRQKGRG
jgi:hypothetical protein